MPAFTAVGTYVAGTILGLTGTAALVVGTIVATGAAYITSRVINGNPNKGRNAAEGSQGGRIQVPPATNNKIPVVYGNAYVNGTITDARLTNENKTMYYCIVLSETCNNASAAYEIDNVYWNDLRLTTVDSTTNAHKIKDGRKTVDGPGEDFIDTNFIVDNTSLVELRVYAGSTAAADQIFPTQASGNTQNAYAFWPDSDWDNTYEMKGLVFAIVKVNYNGEKGFTGLPNMTFQLDNNINNPADVWYDYMTSSRYGANINSSAIDTTPTTSALAQWRDYCDELITYTPVGGGSTTQKRYTINGVIDTSREVKTNIDIILQNGAAWLSYDVSTGQWTPITKRAATVSEFANALQFSDDNIISGISISSTRLEDLYNKLEVEFYDKYNKDQKAYARLNLPSIQRNPNEPDNQLRMSLDLVNNSVQAELIGQIELRQSRDDLVVEFTTNQYGIQAQAGDVIAITSELYGWAPKYFRVMRVKEQETEDGGLIASIQALEYNSDVYSVEDITEFTTSANIGIGVYAASPNLPLPPAVVIAAIDADSAIPNFQLQIEIPTSGGPFDEIELYYHEGWDEHLIEGTIVPGTGSNGAAVGQGLLTVTATTYGNINPGDRVDLDDDIFVVSQLTNTPASKTFVSGGVPADPTLSRLITLNDVNDLIVGNTLTGTGIPNGSFILEIDAGTNTVRIEDAVTVQAAGTYTVSGGLGTYVVDTSTTLSGSAYLYDIPETDKYKLLKKIVPEGNLATFTNGQIITDVVTNVPANSATYRRWFIIARMGIKKRFGSFSQPGETDYDAGRFPYKPNPSANGGPGVFGDIEIAVETPTTISVVGNNEFITISQTSTSTDVAQNGVRISVESTGTPEPGFGTNLEFEIESAPGVKKLAGVVQCQLTDVTTDAEDAKMIIALMTDGDYIPVPQLTLENNGNLTITGDLRVNGNDIKASDGTTALTLADSTGNVTVAGDLTVSGSNINTGVGNIIQIDRTSSSTNSSAIALKLRSTSTGTPLVGFGTALVFENQTATSNFEPAGYIKVDSTDITAGSENFVMKFGLMQNGSPFEEKMSLSDNGDLTITGTNLKTDETTFNIETTSGDTQTLNIGCNTLDNNSTKTINIGNGSVFSTNTSTIINLGVDDSGLNSEAGSINCYQQLAAYTGLRFYTSNEVNYIQFDTSASSTSDQIYKLPTAYPAANGYILSSLMDGTLSWIVNNTGDVVGPGSSTDNAIARFDSTTGKLLKNSGVTIDNINNIAGAVDVAATSLTISALSTRTSGQTTTTSTSEIALVATGRTSMKVVINIKDNVTNAVHICEALLIEQDATTALLAVYGEMYSSTSLASFSADVSGGNVRLLVTPASTNSTTFTYLRDSLG